jgi:hypothetical protein
MRLSIWFLAGFYLYTATADQSHQDHDDGNDEQDVDEAADGVRSDQAEQPQDNQDNGNSIEHDESPHWGLRRGGAVNPVSRS